MAGFGGPTGRLARLFVVVALLGVTLSTATVSSAQESGQVDDSTYRFGLSGTEVRWQGDWELDPTAADQDEGFESFGLISPLAGLFIGQIASPVPVDLDELLTIALDSLAEDTDEFVTVERSATDAVSYSLDAAVLDGVAIALFTYVQFDPAAGIITYTSIYSDYATFAANIADAQANVTVNGRIALEGIDGAILQGLLPPLEGGAPSAGGGRPGGDDEDGQGAEGGEDADDEREADPPPDGEADDEQDDGPAEDDGDTGDPDDEPSDAEQDLAALGVVEDGLYESPQYGVEVAWAGDWQLAPELLRSDEDAAVDSLGLLGDDGEALLVVAIIETDDQTPADFADLWSSDEFLEENASEDAEVLLEDSDQDAGAVLLADETEDGDEVWTLRQATSLDGFGTVAVVTLVAPAESFPDHLDAAQDDIELDGEPAAGLFSVEDVQDAA